MDQLCGRRDPFAIHIMITWYNEDCIPRTSALNSYLLDPRCGAMILVAFTT